MILKLIVNGGFSSILAVLFVLALYCAVDSASARKSSLSIIDVHTHLVPGPGLRFEKALAAAIVLMDRYGVGTSVLMSPPRKAGIRRNYDAADFRAATEKYPGRFVYLGGGGTLNRMLHSHSDPTLVTRRVRRKFSARAQRLISQGAKGFGEMSSLHISLLRQHGYSYVPADHPLLKLLADIAAANGVPIDLHMDAVRDEMKPPPRLAKLPNNPKIFPATLNALENLLSHNRQAIIVWAHGGSDHLGDLSATTVAGLIERHSNLHLSLRVSGPRAKTHNKLFSPGRVNANWLSLLKRFPNRFTIGSDNFYADPEGSGAIAEFSRNAEPRLRATATFLSLLPAYLAQKIGRDNAIRIYGFVDGDAPTMPASSSTPPASRGRCRDGNMAHCRIACSRGASRACARLKRGK